MALIVEDGSGLATAESYISVADATAYFALRGNASWATIASDTIREQLLRQATDYMEGYYGQAWKGLRVGLTQALSWPRADVELPDVGGQFTGSYQFVFPYNQVPKDVATACADLALLSLAGPLAPDMEPLIKSEKTDVLETVWADGSPPYTIYRGVAMKLAKWLNRVGNTVSLVRC